MHLGLDHWMRPEPLEDSADRARRHGYRSMEITGDPESYRGDEVARVLASRELECWGVVTLMRGDRDLQSADAERRRRTEEYVRACLRLSRDAGGRIITLVPGTSRKLVPEDEAHVEWDRLVDTIGRLADAASEMGVRIALEPLNRYEAYLVSNVDKALEVCEAVGPHLGVALDAFHMNIEEVSIPDAISRAGSRILDFHVADNNRLAAGMGSIDWPRVIAALREAGYEGSLTAEFVPPVERTPRGVSSGHFEAPTTPPVITASYFEELVRTNAETLRAALAG